jgi:hypothetical protein
MKMAKAKTAKMRPALRLALLRDLHIYVSVFVAPSLLFFAATGALQTFRIPDQKEAPALLVKLARVHKDDVFALKPERPKPPAGKKAEAPPKKPPPELSTTVLKWFFTVVSVGIMASTILGLWMALGYSRRKAVIWAILAVGAAAPILILMT